MFTDAASILFEIETKVAKVQAAGLEPIGLVLNSKSMKTIAESYALKVYINTDQAPPTVKNLPVIVSDFIQNVGVVTG